MINRRHFIAGTLTTVLAQTVSSSVLASSFKGSSKNSMIFDAMGEMRPTYSRSLIEEIRKSGLNAITVTLTDPKVYEQQAYIEAKMGITEYDNFIAQFPDLLTKGRAIADISKARRENKIAVFYLFQNSAQFGRDISRVEEFYKLGVRSSQLTYNYQNWVGAGCKELNGSGITRFGTEIIKEMNRVGMLIDLSHANEATMLNAIDASSQPTIISHTGFQSVHKNIRNTSDKVLKALANKGGVAGVCQIRPFLTHARPDVALSAYFDHIVHAVNTAGIDHIAIGSDRDHRVITMTDEYLAELAEEEGENFNIKEWPLYIDELNGPNRMEVIWEGLRKRNYSSLDIEKIMGKNLQQLYKNVIG
ncbi:membrane dipeptidase [uncultured Paraglaciecola sp.]|uniref:dipeptidase n=1 Tax=uncultured Paraglaciecola sp. TaxID=1765024 RepID=UPI0026182A42|nr:membrane dipeptidase [uncultured Paraglaciecola sp.]